MVTATDLATRARALVSRVRARWEGEGRDPRDEDATSSADDALLTLGLVMACAVALAAFETETETDSDPESFSLISLATSAALLLAGIALAALAARAREAWLDRTHRERLRTSRERGVWYLVEYDWEPGAVYPAQLVGWEGKSGFTVKFAWGCLQMSTAPHRVRWSSATTTAPELSWGGEASGGGAGEDAAPEESSGAVQDETGDTVYLAARRGDLAAVKRLLPRLAHVDDPELVGRERLVGRSALYWACLTGHLDVVEYLLSRGADDKDGSAFAAATCAAPVLARDDARDLLFDPDTGVYAAAPPDAGDAPRVVNATDGRDDLSRRIRAALTRAKLERTAPISARDPALLATKDLHRVFAADDHGDRDPACVVCFRETGGVAGLAVCLPCGHAATCGACARRLHKEREPCPVCRGRIRAVVEHGSSSSSAAEAEADSESRARGRVRAGPEPEPQGDVADADQTRRSRARGARGGGGGGGVRGQASATVVVVTAGSST